MKNVSKIKIGLKILQIFFNLKKSFWNLFKFWIIFVSFSLKINNSANKCILLKTFKIFKKVPFFEIFQKLTFGFKLTYIFLNLFKASKYLFNLLEFLLKFYNLTKLNMFALKFFTFFFYILGNDLKFLEILRNFLFKFMF